MRDKGQGAIQFGCRRLPSGETSSGRYAATLTRRAQSSELPHTLPLAKASEAGLIDCYQAHPPP